MALARIAQVATATTAKVNSFLIGQCVPCLKENVCKVRVKRLELDVNLNMYFKSHEYFHAVDKGNNCQPGDIVLIRELPEKITKLISHQVLEIVHPYGDITDPITGKKVVVGRYRDEIEKDKDRYGRVDTSFEYEEAPSRGWQKDKKDFTYRKPYMKYHVFPEEDPYAIPWPK